MKLKFKLGSLVIAIMGIVLIGICTLLVREMTNISRDLSVQGIKYLAQDQTTYWKSWVDGRFLILRTLADVMAGYESIPAQTRRDQFDNMLMGIITSTPEIIQIYTVWKPNAVDGMDAQYTDRTGSGPAGQYAVVYTRESGKIQSRVTGDIDKSMAYFNSPDSRKDRLEPPFLRNMNGKDVYLLRLMVPIINSRTSEVVGGVGFLLDISMIQQEVTKIINQYDEIAALTVFVNNGFILGHKVPNRVGKMLQDVETIFGKHTDAANLAVKEGRPFQLRTYSPVLESNVELVVTPFPIGNSDITWSVMVVSTEKHILAPVRKITEYTAIIAVTAIVIAGIILFFVLGSVIRPIVKVTDTIKDISEGEGDLTQTIIVKSKDEVGDLARYFNKLMSALKAPISEVKKTVVSLSSVSEKLSLVSKELASAAEETATQSTTVASTTEQMAENINAMAGGAEEASVNANDVAGNAEEMSTNMNTIAAAIEEMSASISEITNNANDARRVVEDATVKSGEATSTMNRLGTAAKEIGKVTDVIKQIADKTNLLALNATIEAASAGEAGKGFAVVASEIKELATQSARSADDIAHRIEGIQQETGDAVKVISDVSDIINKINDSVESIVVHVEQQSKASNEIASNVAQANLGAHRVASAIHEVASGSHDIARNAGEAAKGATHVSQNVVGVNQAAKEISKDASQVSHSAEDLSKMAETLRAAMDKFKV